MTETQKWALKVARAYLNLSLWQFSRKLEELKPERRQEMLAQTIEQHSAELLDWLANHSNLVESR